ncbi:hypothetical protein ACJJTC_006286 [Scirpophaga incertulas]
MDRIFFTVNGVKCHVGCEVSSDVTLLDYLRNYLEFRGTKYMCREGGCGACIVSAVKAPGTLPVAVNACLVSITSCLNWDITTIEHVGNRKDGYHEIQKTLAEYNGTQCGYCTPGWVMAMYSLLKSQKKITELEIEGSFGSNICRCTGYRPILDAFKKFASDNPKSITDIEDLTICKKTGESCSKSNCENEDDWCIVSGVDYRNILEINLKDGKTWYRVTTVRDAFEIISRKVFESYILVAGNTAKGVYPIEDYPSTLIDISGIAELKSYAFGQNLVIGAGCTLTEVLQIFDIGSSHVYFSYLKTFYDHLILVAHLPVRNIGTLGGNLMIKHAHNEFPSDIFLLLETVGAVVTIRHLNGLQFSVSMQQFLKSDMRGVIIINVALPPLIDGEYKIVTYKIMPRAQSAHAIVNAGFLYRIRQSDYSVRQSRIVYSGLKAPSSRGYQTEKFLHGKKLFINDTLKGALKILEQELVAVENPPDPSAEYRKKLALSLFYKSLLSLCPHDILDVRYRSGSTKIHETRPVSDARQIFDTNPAQWPLTQPLQKVEALIQCSGEAQYTEDIPSFPHEVFGAFVLTTEGSGNIVSIDASQALNLPGVIAFYTAKDIPGLNSFTPADALLYSVNEEVLCSGAVKYYNQPLGIVVAESRYLADRAAKLIRVSYKNVSRPVIDIKEAIRDKSRVKQYIAIDATDKGNNVESVIKGMDTIYHQYHFSMETLVCVVTPSEQGLEVHSATQWMDGTQIMIARALNMDLNSIDVFVRRLGGAYGIKISRSIQSAVAASLVAKLLNRPCRFIQSLTTNMRAVGKRQPTTSEYEVGVNNLGEIQYLDYNLYGDNGYIVNEELYNLGLDVIQNAYNSTRWNIKGNNVTTDTHKSTWCRSPGTLEAIAMVELIMERISYEASIDPIQVRLANLNREKFGELLEMYEMLKDKSNYQERRTAVNKFNSENRWKKRGLRAAFMKWTPSGPPRFDVNISVYHADGTINVTHSAIEMGQGINTKAIQIVSYFLKVPVEKIKVKGNNTIIGPNAFITGGSIANQSVSIALQRACEELLQRLKPVKDRMPAAKWEELIKAAYDSDVDLQCHGFVRAADSLQYNCCGIVFAEVELDILTGESEIIRVDLMEDPGRSLNPEIDIGQVEGAFIMGMGYWTLENLVFDPRNGEILTDRTWNYYVPQARDIPQDFRVYFTRKYPAPDAILGAKAIGEPGICLSIVIPFALREALVSARRDAGLPVNKWFELDGPYTLEKLHLNSATKIEDFKFY